MFFFSSRRRHTRLQGDWSSDVCSSDLAALAGAPAHQIGDLLAAALRNRFRAGLLAQRLEGQIGRASCRERVEITGDSDSVIEYGRGGRLNHEEGRRHEWERSRLYGE